MVSKSGQDLRRYFPEIAQQALAFTRKRFVLDGELVVPDGKHFSFDRLLQRIHPAEAASKSSLTRRLPYSSPLISSKMAGGSSPHNLSPSVVQHLRSSLIAISAQRPFAYRRRARGLRRHDDG